MYLVVNCWGCFLLYLYLQAGLDSLGAVDLRNSLSTAFALDLPAMIAFDYPTPAALTKYITSKLPQACHVTGGKEGVGASNPRALHAGVRSHASRIATKARVKPSKAGQRQSERVNEVQSIVSVLVSEVIGSQSEPQQPLMEAGLDSLGSVELQNALAQRFNISLPPTTVFNYPSIAALSSHISTLVSATDGNGMEVAESDCEGIDLPLITPDSTANNTRGTMLVGSGCIYPGSQDTSGFWAAAAIGKNVQKLVPVERWDVDWCYSSDAALGKSYARFAAFAKVINCYSLLFQFSYITIS